MRELNEDLPRLKRRIGTLTVEGKLVPSPINHYYYVLFLIIQKIIKFFVSLNIRLIRRQHRSFIVSLYILYPFEYCK